MDCFAYYLNQYPTYAGHTKNVNEYVDIHIPSWPCFSVQLSNILNDIWHTISSNCTFHIHRNFLVTKVEKYLHNVLKKCIILFELVVDFGK
jgi:hypothetical protein